MKTLPYFARLRGFRAAALILLGTAPLGCSQKPPALKFTWAVHDQAKNTNSYYAPGATATIQPNDPYTVTLQVQDPKGIRSMQISDSGNFMCSTQENLNGHVFSAADPLRGVAFSPQSATLTRAGDYYGFVVSPLTSPFVYSKSYCGDWDYDNTPGYMKYYAQSGTLDIVGTETSWTGETASPTLDLNPASE